MKAATARGSCGQVISDLGTPPRRGFGALLVEQIERKKRIESLFIGHRVLRPTADINEGLAGLKRPLVQSLDQRFLERRISGVERHRSR